MSWLTQYKDPTMAELMAQGHISGGGSINSALLKPLPNQWLDLLNHVAPAIKDYIQKKKTDEIANQLMNMEQPPRAQAIGYDQGAPATQPFTGGAQGMKLQNAYQSYLDQQQADAVKAAQAEQTSRLNEAKIASQNSPEAPRTGPSYVDTPLGRMTAQQWADYQRKQVKAEGGLPKGVSQSLYENSKTQNFNPAQAFQDAIGQAQTGPSDIPDAAAQKKPLDAATAKSILVEAGGDKEKARQLARERGFTF